MTIFSSGRAAHILGGRLLGWCAAIATCVAVSAGVADRAEAEVTGLSVQAAGAARYFPATDGRIHVEYDLITTNGLQGDATLRSLVVRSGRRTVLELEGDALKQITHPLKVGVNNPVDVVAGGSSVVSLVDVALPGSARKPPPELTSTVRYAVATGPLSNLVDRTRVTVRTPVAGAPPVVIAPPLRGSGWWGFNACCDPNGSHRSGVAALGGVFKIVEAYAIDYMKVVRGSVVRGDGAEVTDFFNYGRPVHSVAGGRVVAVHRGVPNALWPPPDSGPPNPEVKTSADYTGESVIAKIAPHRFALYAHLAPGSIRVEEGQRLNTGQVIGELGNSGNSYAPHLHFAVQSKPSPFAASRPYVFDRFKLEGYGIPDPATPGSGDVVVTPDPRREHRLYPLAGTVTAYGNR